MSRSERIRETRDGGVVTLHFADPDRLNAMTREMGEAFRDRIAGLAADDSIRALVLTGEGRAFSAGGDLDMLQAKADQGAAAPGVAWRAIRDEMASFYRLFLSLRDLACPTIAAINGHAIGAGLCVALGCDLRFVAREARLGLNFTRLGVHPGMAATWNLPRLVPGRPSPPAPLHEPADRRRGGGRIGWRTGSAGGRGARSGPGDGGGDRRQRASPYARPSRPAAHRVGLDRGSAASRPASRPATSESGRPRRSGGDPREARASLRGTIGGPWKRRSRTSIVIADTARL
ncbi:MAG: enoyl-CoA hydratase/isomerase family protein [Myxococcota bacterium]